jgi:hypothetical protein
MAPRQTPFQRSHALEFGLEIVGGMQSGDESMAVSAVRCLFCVYYGRDCPAGSRKRKRTENIQIFEAPFMRQNYKSHMKQHVELFAEYSSLPTEEKRVFFEGKQKKANTLEHYLDISKDAYTVSVSASIVDIIIKDMFYRHDDQVLAGIDDLDEGNEDNEDQALIMERMRQAAAKKIATKRNATKLFVLNDEETKYDVSISNTTRFDMAIRGVGIGLSFRQTAAMMQITKDVCHLPKLTGINDHLVGKYVRVLVAANLQLISDLLLHPSIWAFSLAGDGSTHRGDSFFDMRIRVCAKGKLTNLHLVAIPMFERHTAENTFKLIEKFLDALAITAWRAKLLSVATDGENTMTGRHNGVVTRLSRASEHPVLRIWCAPHQLDIVIKGAAALPESGQWIVFVYKWCVHLRRQDKLIIEMGGRQCPKKTNRWAHLDRTLQFFISYRRQIVLHTDAHPTFASPTPRWWVISCALAPAIAEISKVVVQLQNKALIIIQQQMKIDMLKTALIDMFSVQSIGEVDLNELDPDQYYSEGDWIVQLHGIECHIHDQGTFSKTCYDLSLDEQEQRDALRQIARFAIHFVAGCDGVRAERDADNNAAFQDAPPVVPQQLVKLPPRHFVSDVLDVYRVRLNRFWTEEDVEKIEVQHRELVRRYSNDRHVKTIIDSFKHTTQFNEAWDELGIPFEQLRQFCGGLATAFPNTTSVESDFSVLKWEMDPNRSSMTDLSLEGIFQAKQMGNIPVA